MPYVTGNWLSHYRGMEHHIFVTLESKLENHAKEVKIVTLLH